MCKNVYKEAEWVGFAAKWQDDLHVLTGCQALQLSLGSAGFVTQLPIPNLALPILCSPPIRTVCLTDADPQPRRGRVWFEATAGVWGWRGSPGVFSPKAHPPAAAFLSLHTLPLGLTFWSATYGNNHGTHANWL